jgi:hypothetical protein
MFPDDNYYVDVVFEPSVTPVKTIYKALSVTTSAVPSLLLDWSYVDIDFNRDAYPTTAATPNTIVTRDGLGGFNTSGVIYTGSQVKNKVVVLYGDPTNQDATDSYSLGINSGTFRYNVPTGAFHRFYVNASDIVDVGSGGMIINTGGLYLPTLSGTQSALNYYEEYTWSMQFIWLDVPSYVPISNVRLVRVNNVVTASFPIVRTQPGISSRLSSTAPIPARFRPVTAPFWSMITLLTDVYTTGLGSVDGSGYVQINATPTQNKFPAAGYSGFHTFTATWNVGAA